MNIQTEVDQLKLAMGVETQDSGNTQEAEGIIEVETTVRQLLMPKCEGKCIHTIHISVAMNCIVFRARQCTYVARPGWGKPDKQ